MSWRAIGDTCWIWFPHINLIWGFYLGEPTTRTVLHQPAVSQRHSDGTVPTLLSPEAARPASWDFRAGLWYDYPQLHYQLTCHSIQLFFSSSFFSFYVFLAQVQMHIWEDSDGGLRLNLPYVLPFRCVAHSALCEWVLEFYWLVRAKLGSFYLVGCNWWWKVFIFELSDKGKWTMRSTHDLTTGFQSLVLISNAAIWALWNLSILDFRVLYWF